MALVKHNNNSISAVTSMASLTIGSMTLIKEQTASSSASISFVDGSSDVVLDSTYPIYKFEFINIHSANNDVAYTFQTSTNSGSSYGVTATTTVFIARHHENDSAAVLTYQSSDDEAQSTNFLRLSSGQGNANDESLSGELFLYNPSSTTFVKHFMARDSYYHESNIAFDWYTAGYFNTTSAIDGVQFKFNSGNTDSGTIKLYGIKDS
jgi:hypothetical protein